MNGLQLFNSLAKFARFYIQDVAIKCSECPLECESEFYTLTTSSLDYPTKIYADMLSSQGAILSRFNNKKPTYQQIKQSIASININYNQLGYTEVKEAQKITAIDLVTNVGGTMGLFMGLSFLSFIEIIELLIEIIFVFFEKKYSHKKLLTN